MCSVTKCRPLLGYGEGYRVRAAQRCWERDVAKTNARTIRVLEGGWEVATARWGYGRMEGSRLRNIAENKQSRVVRQRRPPEGCWECPAANAKQQTRRRRRLAKNGAACMGERHRRNVKPSRMQNRPNATYQYTTLRITNQSCRQENQQTGGGGAATTATLKLSHTYIRGRYAKW